MIRERASDPASGVDGARAGGGTDAGVAEFARSIGADPKELRRSLRQSLRQSLGHWRNLEFRRPHLGVAGDFFVTALATTALIGAVAVTVTASIALVVGLSSLFVRWTVGGIPEFVGSACGWGLSLGLVLLLRGSVRHNIVRTAAWRLAEKESIDGAAPSAHRAPPQKLAGVRP